MEEGEARHDRTRRYAGKARDATGLYYYGYRYYQPGSGRWLSADPGGLVDGVNLFRFCRGNPVGLTDRDGRLPEEAAVAALAARMAAYDTPALNEIIGAWRRCIPNTLPVPEIRTAADNHNLAWSLLADSEALPVAQEAMNRLMNSMAEPDFPPDALSMLEPIILPDPPPGPARGDRPPESATAGSAKTCTLCKKSFSSISHLKTHMRFHTGERLFVCDICEQKFVTKSNLAVHIRTHTGERPFACETCGKAFFQKGHLKTHMRTHTGERPFACETCGKAFTCQHNLIRHVSICLNAGLLGCKTCGKTFILQSHLNSHRQTHKEERRFTCRLCGFAFSFKWRLDRHHKTVHRQT